MALGGTHAAGGAICSQTPSTSPRNTASTGRAETAERMVTGMAERRFCVMLAADTDDSISFIREDIETELGCACVRYEILSIEECGMDGETDGVADT